VGNLKQLIESENLKAAGTMAACDAGALEGERFDHFGDSG
jgi:hypothetical protein